MEFDSEKRMWVSPYTPVWRREPKRPYCGELKNLADYEEIVLDWPEFVADDVDVDYTDDDAPKYHDGKLHLLLDTTDTDDDVNPSKKQKIGHDVMGDTEDENEEQMPRLDNGYHRLVFNRYPENEDLDIYVKRATLQASASVVALQFSNGGALIQCSGFILEHAVDHSMVLTSTALFNPSSGTSSVVKVLLSDGRAFHGEIVVYDFTYSIAAIRTHIQLPRPAASTSYMDDHITVGSFVRSFITLDPNHFPIVDKRSSQSSPHPTTFSLTPGDVVVALARLPIDPYSIMAAPGLFSADYSNHKCGVVFTTSCRITECGIGGPLINQYGEVIGVCLYDDGGSTAFLPINIALMWWEEYAEKGETHGLVLGMEVTNLYAAPIGIVERIIEEFPDITGGVIVKKVPLGSAREDKIHCNDIIVAVNGIQIHSTLELYKNIWIKFGQLVTLDVKRAGVARPVKISMEMSVESQLGPGRSSICSLKD